MNHSSHAKDDVYNVPFTYLMEKMQDGKHYSDRISTAYAMSVQGAQRAVNAWNKIGAVPSRVGGLTWRYTLLTVGGDKLPYVAD